MGVLDLACASDDLDVLSHLIATHDQLRTHLEAALELSGATLDVNGLAAGAVRSLINREELRISIMQSLTKNSRKSSCEISLAGPVRGRAPCDQKPANPKKVPSVTAMCSISSSRRPGHTPIQNARSMIASALTNGKGTRAGRPKK